MAFPVPQAIGQPYTDGGSTWIWDGVAWSRPPVGHLPPLAPAVVAQLVYVASPGQTVFPLTTPDQAGRSYALGLLSELEGVNVHVDGSLLFPQEAGIGLQDFTVNHTASIITLNAPVAAGARVVIDVLAPPSSVASPSIRTREILHIDADWSLPGAPTGLMDGVRVEFDLYARNQAGIPTPIVATVEEDVAIFRGGQRLRPRDDYTILGSRLTFTTPPTASEAGTIWAIWYNPGDTGGSAGAPAPQPPLNSYVTQFGWRPGTGALFRDARANVRSVANQAERDALTPAVDTIEGSMVYRRDTRALELLDHTGWWVSLPSRTGVADGAILRLSAGAAAWSTALTTAEATITANSAAIATLTTDLSDLADVVDALVLSSEDGGSVIAGDGTTGGGAVLLNPTISVDGTVMRNTTSQAVAGSLQIRSATEVRAYQFGSSDGSVVRAEVSLDPTIDRLRILSRQSAALRGLEISGGDVLLHNATAPADLVQPTSLVSRDRGDARWLRWRGAWVAGTYAPLSVVVDTGLVFVALVSTAERPGNAAARPPFSADWQLLGGGGASAVHIGSTPPAVALPGDLWFRDVAPVGMFVRYEDADSAQWVAAFPIPEQTFASTSQMQSRDSATVPVSPAGVQVALDSATVATGSYNDLTRAGNYYVLPAVNDGPDLGGQPAFLRVERVTALDVAQTAWRHSATGSQGLRRQRVAGAWSPWRVLPSSGDIVLTNWDSSDGTFERGLAALSIPPFARRVTLFARDFVSGGAAANLDPTPVRLVTAAGVARSGYDSRVVPIVSAGGSTIVAPFTTDSIRVPMNASGNNFFKIVFEREPARATPPFTPNIWNFDLAGASEGTNRRTLFGAGRIDLGEQMLTGITIVRGTTPAITAPGDAAIRWEC
jgi:hypothetical protein